jgi:hypothetical protein
VLLFQDRVLPALRQQCTNCHVTQPRDVGAGGVFATDRIYNYSFLQPLVRQGPSATNNPLYNKVRGIVSHTGAGDQCIGDINGTVSPCRELVEWAQMESPQSGADLSGIVNYVTSLGRVTGFARNNQTPNLAINVVVYVNGPIGQGELVGTYLANLPGAGLANGHTFDFSLPAMARDGVTRRLYIYGGSALAANLLPGMPYSYTAYTSTQAGIDYFEATVRPRLATACANCHTWTYESAYARLTNPLPIAGGTSLNNTLINKMSGMAHGGGNRCGGGKNAEPCSLVRDWWIREFN